MELIVGKYSGFCNGVKNTINKAVDSLNKNDIIYSLGDIVHNEIVINDLKNKGLIVVNNINDVPINSKVIIRAHGEEKNIYDEAKKKNIELIDLTCGKVKIIHQKIMNHDDFFVIIIGKKIHPETIAHQSYSKASYVIEDFDDINEAYNRFKLCGKKNVYIVAQTTFNGDLFDEIVKKIKKKFIDANFMIEKTICNATTIRQMETKEIASKVDKMIVIGGKNSSNTKELEVISKNYCPIVYLIQTKNDLKKDMFNENDYIGIVAGASTPDMVINDVVKYLQSIYNKKK